MTERGYHKFRIYDPKEREIQALCYGDRIVQHSLCDNVLGPYLERHLIYDNSDCRKGKGTRILRQSGKKRLKRKLRNYRHAYANGKIELDTIRQSVASYKGHLKYAHTYRLQKNIWNHFVLRHNEGGETP